MKAKSPVLVSWVAVNNDPYEHEQQSGGYRLLNGKPIPGPTLTLLVDEASPFVGQIKDVVLLHRNTNGPNGERERCAVEETKTEIHKCLPSTRVHPEIWQGKDPTDHRGIFEFLQKKIPEIRRRFTGHELIIHVSPGTPAMHTIWVLMAETGFIEPPFQLVQSLRKKERHGRPAIIPVKVGIETFYKVYMTSRPAQVASDDQSVVWDPAKFRTVAMQQLFIEARRFAQLNVPVLILGERGTGKTTLANWMRLHSPFRQEKLDPHWPSVSCGQYSSETMRSELFGYKKGSFTGAIKDYDGLLATANGDTLFLDEIGDVSRELQRLLIKALEEKRYFSLGSDRPKKSNFRLLTATNITNSELQDRLDPDFLDRINLLTLRLPPLREIRDEIPWLWHTAFEQATQRSGVRKQQVQLSEAHHLRIVSSLMQHQLPGNLRDLFRVAYRVLAARSDSHDSLSPKDAVEYSIRCLDERYQSDTANLGLSRAVAQAFAEATSLDGLLGQNKNIPIKSVEHDLRVYLAEELRRIAKARGISVEQLCDISERTLRGWLKKEKGNSADDRMKTAEK